MYLPRYLFNTNFIEKRWPSILLSLIMIFHTITPGSIVLAEIDPGKKDMSILIGSIMQLTNDSLYYDLNNYSVNMKKGIETALQSQPINDRKKIEFDVMNDSNDPITTV